MAQKLSKEPVSLVEWTEQRNERIERAIEFIANKRETALEMILTCQDLNADINLQLAEVLNDNLYNPTREDNLNDRNNANVNEKMEIPSLFA